MHIRSKTRGMAMLIFVNVMWGLSFIFSKVVLEEGMPVMTLALCRYIITGALMTILCLKKEGSLRLGKWAPMGFATTMLGITVYYFFEYTGLQRTTASAASLILALVPMLTLIARMLLWHKRISAMQWVCVALSLTGAYLVIQTGGDEGAATLAGNLLMVCACLVWTGYILISPGIMEACGSLRVTAWQAVCAAVTLLPLALMERGAWVAVSAKAWGCIILLSLICSALCYVLYNDAIRFVDPLTVSLTINLNPVAACIGGALLLGETMTTAQVLGGVLILLSMLGDALEPALCARKKRT